MSKEAKKILDMLHEGKITAGEANELLKHVADGEQANRPYCIHDLMAHSAHAGLSLLGITVGGLVGGAVALTCGIVAPIRYMADIPNHKPKREVL